MIQFNVTLQVANGNQSSCIEGLKFCDTQNDLLVILECL